MTSTSLEATQGSVVSVRGPVVSLSRRYRFSASHRLHVNDLSAEQNRDVFGKCNNPFGHGHNYVAEITVAGPLDPETRMVVDLVALDNFASVNLAPFECANLNNLPCFAEAVPSTENLCLELWRIFSTFPHAELRCIRVEETGNNSFEYYGAYRSASRPYRPH